MVLFQPNADRLGLAAAASLLLLETTTSERRIQLGEVFDFRNRRRPFAFQRFHAILDHRFFIACCWHAKQRLEHEVTGQSRIARVQFAIAAHQNRIGHCLGVVPPDFFGHTPEKLEGERHSFQNGFCSLGGKGHGKRCVRMRPDQNQYIDFPTSFREIDLNLAEVGFDSLTGLMIEWDEGLFVLLTMLDDKPADGGITSRIAVLIA